MALLDTTYDPKAEATKMSLSEFSLETANYLFTVQEQLLHFQNMQLCLGYLQW